MNMFDFADKHPWWALIYLWLLLSLLPITAYCLRGLIRIKRVDNSKHGYNVDSTVENPQTRADQ